MISNRPADGPTSAFSSSMPAQLGCACQVGALGLEDQHAAPSSASSSARRLTTADALALQAGWSSFFPVASAAAAELLDADRG
jgi:hypothetical protein